MANNCDLWGKIGSKCKMLSGPPEDRFLRETRSVDVLIVKIGAGAWLYAVYIRLRQNRSPKNQYACQYSRSTRQKNSRSHFVRACARWGGAREVLIILVCAILLRMCLGCVLSTFVTFKVKILVYIPLTHVTQWVRCLAVRNC